MSEYRGARVYALAKINLDLRVIGKRPDGYHELRTIFQTISREDPIEIVYAPARKTSIELVDIPPILDNVTGRAAAMVLDELGITARVIVSLTKHIPMGAGLGGGSSDAAAVLLTLPVLAGGVIPLPRLLEMAGRLGSDVPFFLFGGRAAGIGRGTEVFPLPDKPRFTARWPRPGFTSPPRRPTGSSARV